MPKLPEPHEPSMDVCRVCRHPHPLPFMVVEKQRYFRCSLCLATYLDASQLPDAALEESRYRLHRNQVSDPDYRKFLSRLSDPLLTVLPAGSRGLDYGCGPGPALAAMLNEAGHQVTCFDPLFFPDQQSLQTIYDFITCTETAEHFHQPAVEFDRLIGLVRPGGFLGFMTCFQTDDDRFARWSYRRDITHVTFYREHTFRVLAEKLNCMCEVPTKDIVLLRKMETEATSQTQDVDNRSA